MPGTLGPMGVAPPLSARAAIIDMHALLSIANDLSPRARTALLLLRHSVPTRRWRRGLGGVVRCKGRAMGWRSAAAAHRLHTDACGWPVGCYWGRLHRLSGSEPYRAASCSTSTRRRGAHRTATSVRATARVRVGKVGLREQVL